MYTFICITNARPAGPAHHTCSRAPPEVSICCRIY